MKMILPASWLLLFCRVLIAQPIAPPDGGHKYRFGVVFGLSQPIVTNGFNIELNYYTDKLVFAYSHGFNLHFRNALVTGEAKQQHLAFRISHSLGFGVGYRITPSLNIRIEPKMHLWNVYYDDGNFTQQARITSYATYTLGLGTYYRWMPFQNRESFSRGLTVMPSFRYWPNVFTTLKNNEFSYQNRITNKPAVHQANNIGLNNSPFFANVSVGYTF